MRAFAVALPAQFEPQVLVVPSLGGAPWALAGPYLCIAETGTPAGNEAVEARARRVIASRPGTR